MIEIETVLLLGAGASIPFGFPSGQNLVDIICTRLSFNTLQAKTNVEKLFIEGWRRAFIILEQSFSKKRLSTFTDRLLNSGESSVDAFLESQEPEFVEIGKAAITASLLPCELEKTLFMYFMETRRRPGDTEEQSKNWYQYLWGELNAPFEQFEENKLSIVTFNYDRSLEHYLFTALKNKYPGKSNEEYAEKIQSIPIIHVHGKLGPLSWELPNSDFETVVPYDSMTANFGMSVKDTEDYQRIWFDTAQSSIKVIHEGTDESEEFKQAHELITKAQQLYFLGFGYHPTNLRRLNPDVLKKPKKIKGTVYELSLTRICNIERQSISTFNRKNQNLYDKRIYDFLHNDVNFNLP